MRELESERVKEWVSESERGRKEESEKMWKWESERVREWVQESERMRMWESGSVREGGAPEKDGEKGSENQRDEDRTWGRGRVKRNRYWESKREVEERERKTGGERVRETEWERDMRDIERDRDYLGISG